MVQFMENLFGIQAHPEVNVQNFKKVIIPGMLARDKIDEKGTTILRKNSATGFSKSCGSQKDLDKWKEHCKVKESVSNYSYFVRIETDNCLNYSSREKSHDTSIKGLPGVPKVRSSTL